MECKKHVVVVLVFITVVSGTIIHPHSLAFLAPHGYLAAHIGI